jgi:hypothetical protein
MADIEVDEEVDFVIWDLVSGSAAASWVSVLLTSSMRPTASCLYDCQHEAATWQCCPALASVTGLWLHRLRVTDVGTIDTLLSSMPALASLTIGNCDLSAGVLPAQLTASTSLKKLVLTVNNLAALPPGNYLSGRSLLCAALFACVLLPPNTCTASSKRQTTTSTTLQSWRASSCAGTSSAGSPARFCLLPG